MQQRSPRLNQKNLEDEPDHGKRVTVRLPEEDYAALEAEVIRQSVETGKLLNFSVIWRDCVKVYLNELHNRRLAREQ